MSGLSLPPLQIPLSWTGPGQGSQGVRGLATELSEEQLGELEIEQKGHDVSLFKCGVEGGPGLVSSPQG